MTRIQTPSVPTTSPGKAPAGGNVVSIVSPALSRAVLAELMLQPDALSDTMRAALDLAKKDSTAVKALERVTVWADLTCLVLHGLHQEEKEWRKAALAYCVARGATYSMLGRLFKASREEISSVRSALGKANQTGSRRVPTSEVDAIHAAWKEVCEESDREADRWVSMGERFPRYGLDGLYAVVVAEGANHD